MVSNCSLIIIAIVVLIVVYLIYSNNNTNNLLNIKQQNHIPYTNHHFYQENMVPYTPKQNDSECPQCEIYKRRMEQTNSPTMPPITNVLIDNDNDPYSDPIKKQDLHGMYDPLTYPQLRLPREILQKYHEYHEKNGSYPPFGESSQPMFDNPVLNGILIKQTDENDPFADNIPTSVPLFRVKSAKNNNRFFYYILDQRYLSKLELKIPLDHIKINGTRFSNSDFYGLPELYDGDIIENIPIYPNSKFRITLYKTYHFP